MTLNNYLQKLSNVAPKLLSPRGRMLHLLAKQCGVVPMTIKRWAEHPVNIPEEARKNITDVLGDIDFE